MADAIRVDDVRVRRLLDEAQKRSKDVRPVWGDLNANVVQPAMQKRFASAGAFLGSRWKPLSPATRRSRLRQRGGNRGGISRPLWDFARLRGSWIKRGPEAIVSIKRLSFERGTDVPYAAFHQVGAGVPERPLITERLAEHVGDEAAKRLAAYIVEG